MKKQIAVLCASLLTVTTVFSGISLQTAAASAAAPAATESATAMEIVNKENEKEQTEANLQNAEQSKQSLEQDKIQLEGYLGELNTKLQQLSESMNQLEQQIAGKKEQISGIQSDLELAKQDENKQYQEMKKRIQFMYEKGTMSLYSALLTGKGISDMISRTEYIAKISKYDRDMLEKYQETKKNISDNESALLKEQKNLTDMEESLKTQEAELKNTVAQTEENIKKHEQDIAKAELQIQGYEEQIAKQEAELSNLEAIQEAEAIAGNSDEVRQAAQQAQEIANGLTEKMSDLGFDVQDIQPTYGEAYAATETDLVLMATIIYVEAGVESFEGMCAVGACVMNRVRSPEFPNTILGVIYQPGQFTPVRTGRFALALAQGVPQECYRAAQMALNGYNNIGDYLYFRTPNGRVSGLQIGGHIFHDGHVF